MSDKKAMAITVGGIVAMGIIFVAPQTMNIANMLYCER